MIIPFSNLAVAKRTSVRFVRTYGYVDFKCQGVLMGYSYALPLQGQIWEEGINPTYCDVIGFICDDGDVIKKADIMAVGVDSGDGTDMLIDIITFTEDYYVPIEEPIELTRLFAFCKDEVNCLYED